MTIVAGPPGSGKSSRFPLSSFHVDWFNADDRAAELNFGSFRKIPAEIRANVSLEFQEWVLDHISSHRSFAIETTLRSFITFEQARLACEHGFWTAMEYVMAGSVEESVRRITERSYRGGHSASERLVKEIYAKSTQNLLMALDFAESSIEVVRIYDNSKIGGDVKQVLSFRRGQPRSIAAEVPVYVELLLRGATFDIGTVREALTPKPRRSGRSHER